MRKNDAGLKNLLRNLKGNNGLTIEAGIFADAKASRSANGSSADDLAYRLKIHDQGLGNNPQRKVLEPAAEAIQGDIDRNIKAHLKRLHKPGDFEPQAKAIGARFAAQIQRQFTQTSPAKKQSTVRAAERRYGGVRGSNLIQTGEMRQAVTFKVRN